jgi:hypothetical protein
MSHSFSSFVDEMMKISEDVVPAQRAEHPAMPYVKGVAGMALGSGLGYAGMEALNRYGFGGNMGKGEWLRYAVPIAGGLSGLAASGLQGHMLNKAKENWAAREQEAADGGEDS